VSDFLAVLAFVWIPFAGAAAFSLTAAPLGAVLSLRDEILLGLALPPVGTAAIVAAVLVGLPPENTLLLYLVAVAAILAVSLFLPQRRGGAVNTARWRAALLAAIFCGAEAATILMSAGSTRVEAHVQHLLRGELLTIGAPGLLVFLFLTALLFLLGFRFRGLIYALAMDEEGLGIKVGARGRGTLLAFRTLSAVIIAAGVIWVGPLLTLGLLAVPTMLWERRVRGLGPHFLGVLFIGLLGVVIGFLLSIVVDMPPVPVVVLALFVVGGLGLLVTRR
jgi:ABC-type Mn2+/Zn2+ transport system permease subunit